MKIKTVATCSPLLLCLAAGGARAALEPFSFDASETIQHQSNILHTESGNRQADWLSTTELKAALDQAIGRERLLGSAAVSSDNYKSLHSRDSIGYAGKAELDWSTVGDISGALGADAGRHQYLYGLDADKSSTTKNLQTDNHAFARLQIGGLSRWSIFSGFDASERKYSDPDFAGYNTQQWAVSGGTSYNTSPDLAFGLNGRYIRGKYPRLAEDQNSFTIRNVGVHTRWAASADTSFDGNIGYTQQRNDGQPDQHYVNGGVNLRWKPPTRIGVTLGVVRDSSTGASSGATVVNTNDAINGRSLNTIANLDVTYELTAKVSFDALTQYIHRNYSDAQVPTGFVVDGVPVTAPASGTSNTTRFTLTAHYAPTRTTMLSCGFARELHSSVQSLHSFSAPYTDNTALCTASIHFD
jgi:hypothetical protein